MQGFIFYQKNGTYTKDLYYTHFSPNRELAYKSKAFQKLTNNPEEFWDQLDKLGNNFKYVYDKWVGSLQIRDQLQDRHAQELATKQDKLDRLQELIEIKDATIKANEATIQALKLNISAMEGTDL